MFEKITFLKFFLVIYFFLFSLFSNAISERIEHLEGKPPNQKIGKNYFLELAVLYIYQEDFSKSFKEFSKLHRAYREEPSNLFYMAMIKSYLNEREANFLWRSYFQNRIVKSSRKLWLDLGMLVRKIVNNNLDREKNKAAFEDSILFFYLNKAFYTSMLNINIYEKYVIDPNGKDFLKDINFIARIKSGILSNIGYKLDAIKTLEKYSRKYPLTDGNLKKLAILYYQNSFYIQAIENFYRLKSVQEKDFSYYYFLALTHLKISKKKEFEKYREMAKEKIVNKNHQKLFDSLTRIH